jgi:hypothetical protein
MIMLIYLDTICHVGQGASDEEQEHQRVGELQEGGCK